MIALNCELVDQGIHRYIMPDQNIIAYAVNALTLRSSENNPNFRPKLRFESAFDHVRRREVSAHTVIKDE